MGVCDPGRCCKGGLCTEDKKCCCRAKKGVFTLGEVCRTAGCVTGSGCSETSVCACEESGGTLVQSCDPCANVACDSKQCQHCVNGVCVSTCTACQECDSSGIVGVCRPKVCDPCESCISGTCTPYGTPCGNPPLLNCCGNGECCVGGECVPNACDPPCGECYACLCGDCVLSGECGTTADCSSGSVCVSCQCVPPTCCVFVPACGPHGIAVIENGYQCETVTYDYMGSPCTEVRTPLDCAEALCTYVWDGSQWVLEGCSVQTSQGRLIFNNTACCSSEGCPATLADAPGNEGDRKTGISCENPLP